MSSASRRARRIASAHRSARTRSSPAGGDVALVEHEVDDGEHGPQPVGQLGVGRHPVRDLAPPGSCSWPARAAGPSSPRARGTRGRSPGVCSPAMSRSVSATWAVGASAGWQHVKISRSRSSSTGPTSSGSSALVQSGGLGVAVVAGRLPAQPVDGPVAGGRDDPPGRARRDARSRATAARATTNASWTASSAMSMSPKKRTRVATARPDSCRKTCSIVGRSGGAPGLGLVLEGPHLDRALAGRGGLRRPLQRGVEVGGLDDPEATELLLGLGERAVGGDDLAVLDLDHRRGVGRVRGRRRTPTRPLPAAWR